MGNNKICKTLLNNNQLQITVLNKCYQKYRKQPYQYIFDKFQSSQIVKNQENMFKLLLQEITKYYNNVPYHNITHAFDVMIATDKYLIQYNMIQKIKLTQQERFYILLAAYAHDNGHQGYTNNFYINSEGYIARLYSYNSPLQNMHSFNLLESIKKYNLNIKKQMKQLMIMLILATDNKHHFQLLNQIKEINKLKNKDLSQNNKQITLKMLIHTADINTCGKPLEIYMKWNERLYEEFYQQYKTQRKLQLKNYSFDFDQKNLQLSVIKSNIGFFEHLVLPFFKQISIMMPQFSAEYQNSLKINQYFQQQKNKLQQKKAVIRLKKN